MLKAIGAIFVCLFFLGNAYGIAEDPQLNVELTRTTEAGVTVDINEPSSVESSTAMAESLRKNRVHAFLSRCVEKRSDKDNRVCENLRKKLIR